MKSNVATRQRVKPKTHEGGVGEISKDPLAQLERVVATCLLFEDTFYESGASIAQRIYDLCAASIRDYKDVGISRIVALAYRARDQWKLRHVPLFLMSELAKLGGVRPANYAGALEGVIRRPDELSEFLAIYWKPKKRPLPAQMKHGLAMAFQKFDEYQLQKWNRDREIMLRDVMRLVHPKPKDTEQAAMWKRLISGDLAVPDTWEVAISACRTREQKKAEWTRLLTATKTDDRGRNFSLLGDMAFLMNLRNMRGWGVESAPIRESMADDMGEVSILSTARVKQ